MKEFHFRLYQAADGTYMASILSPEGCDCYAVPAAGFPCALRIEPQQLREAQRELIEASPGQHRTVLEEVGKQLFDLLHRDPAATENGLYTYWQQCFEESRGAGGMRTVLHIDQGSTGDELAATPWELMCSEVDGGFRTAAMAIDIPHSMVRVRDRPGVNYREVVPLASGETLRVLVVLGHKLTEDELIQGQEEALQVDQGLFPLLPWQVDLRVLVRPSVPLLSEWFAKWKPHVFHFVGHGRYNGNTPTLLLTQGDVEDAGSLPAELKPSDLLGLFQGGVPRLVVLNACRSGQNADPEAAARTVRGFSGALIAGGVLAVIAMQGDIHAAAAVALMGTFYSSLAEGKSVDLALTAARHAVIKATLAAQSQPTGAAAAREAGGATGPAQQMWAWALPALYVADQPYTAGQQNVEQVIRLDTQASPLVHIFALSLDELPKPPERHYLAWPVALRALVAVEGRPIALPQLLNGHQGDHAQGAPPLVLFMGEAGTGKTAHMFVLAECCKRRNQPFIYADLDGADLNFWDTLRLIRDGCRKHTGRGVQLAGGVGPEAFNRFTHALNSRVRTVDSTLVSLDPPEEGVAIADLVPEQGNLDHLLVVRRSDEIALEVLARQFWADLMRAARDKELVLFLDHMNPELGANDVNRLLQYLVLPALQPDSKVRLVMAFKGVASSAELALPTSPWAPLFLQHSDAIREAPCDTLPANRVQWLSRVWARRYFLYSRLQLRSCGLAGLVLLLERKQIGVKEVEAYAHWILAAPGLRGRDLSPRDLVERFTDLNYVHDGLIAASDQH